MAKEKKQSVVTKTLMVIWECPNCKQRQKLMDDVHFPNPCFECGFSQWKFTEHIAKKVIQE
jgi:Zn ribbon nucleic-acid-binding protein